MMILVQVCHMFECIVGFSNRNGSHQIEWRYKSDRICCFLEAKSCITAMMDFYRELIDREKCIMNTDHECPTANHAATMQVPESTKQLSIPPHLVSPYPTPNGLTC